MRSAPSLTWSDLERLAQSPAPATQLDAPRWRGAAGVPGYHWPLAWAVASGSQARPAYLLNFPEVHGVLAEVGLGARSQEAQAVNCL